MTAPQRLQRAREDQPEVTAFDVRNTPLEALNIIEANAGTGKTWTITALYVRLLLEAERTVDQILVVTFTEAATAELRDRIRNRLADTRAAFQRGRGDNDLDAALLGRVASREQTLLRLTMALRDFDKAPIYTIHGFCQRVLGDSAFESGMPVRTEILVDQIVLLQEIVDDWWRNETSAATSLFARFLTSTKLRPDKLREEVEPYVAKPYLELRAPDHLGDLAGIEQAYERAFARARTIWLADRASIEAMLTARTSLNAQSYRVTSIPGWLEEMHACLCSGAVGLDLCDKFDRFTTEALVKATRKGATTPRHRFFEACDEVKGTRKELMDAYARRLAGMKASLVRYCNAELAARKERARLQSYDDLLLNLDRALQSEQGASFAASLRDRYSAALVDEFQDTDPVQYDIFRRIYAGAALPVFFVGDPKQSIYRFRGADVFSYLAARRTARRRHTLGVNWRSEPRLLEAVNRLFQNVPDSFVLGEIPFHESKAAPGNRGAFEVDGKQSAPITMWLLEGSEGKPVAKGVAAAAASSATAAEIARLLNAAAVDRARLTASDGMARRRLRGGDIAVLVRNHRQAQNVRQALADVGVASVQRGAQNVFVSREAEELERVLLAIAEPGRETLIGSALATEMVGMAGEALYALRADEREWERTIESFRDAHREWRERGFLPMLRTFLKRFDVVCRLLAYVDGERRVTNLEHLAELLHCEAGKQGTSGLLAWFAVKRNTASNANLEELLRLESDENLVKILTIYTAKGLEFPLVFCPFLWDGKLWSRDDGAIAFHEPTTGHAVVDFAPDARARDQALLEERAENMRLLYVALTRAKYRCWMVWGNIKDASSSAPAWLLHRTGEGKGVCAELSAVLDALPVVDLKDVRATLERLAVAAGGAIAVETLSASADVRLEPAETAGPVLSALTFTGVVHDTRRVTSFTGLAHGRSIEAPDYDAAEREPQVEPASGARAIFAFPRGARAGKCIHAIFENVDFTDLARPALERLVGRELASHGFEGAWVSALADMVESVVATPLDESATLRLDRVPLAKRLDELEFYYPIADLTHAGLKQILLGHGFPGDIRERIGELTFAPIQGYMRGFIDIVFEHAGRYYLADYKSNWLGATVEFYGHAALTRAMAREAYYLQYLVYCVALHRYLGLRISDYAYDTHFGGIRYLFVRGMSPATGSACGVYADRPDAAMIEALDRYLATGRS